MPCSENGMSHLFFELPSSLQMGDHGDARPAAATVPDQGIGKESQSERKTCIRSPGRGLDKPSTV